VQAISAECNFVGTKVPSSDTRLLQVAAALESLVGVSKQQVEVRGNERSGSGWAGITGEIAQKRALVGKAALSSTGGWSDQIIASAQQFEESENRGVGGLRGEPLE